jgi:hypothetical protein
MRQSMKCLHWVAVRPSLGIQCGKLQLQGQCCGPAVPTCALGSISGQGEHALLPLLNRLTTLHVMAAVISDLRQSATDGGHCMGRIQPGGRRWLQALTVRSAQCRWHSRLSRVGLPSCELLLCHSVCFRGWWCGVSTWGITLCTLFRRNGACGISLSMLHVECHGTLRQVLYVLATSSSPLKLTPAR